MQVTVLSRKSIKPSTPTPNHLRTYRLSFFDQLAPQVHVPLIFFYPAADGSNLMEESNGRLQQLEKSLSEILTLFYPQAGRFVKDDLLVDCNDQGVEYLEAKANAHLIQFLSEGPQPELLNHFVPWDMGAAISVTTPMVAIQVTVFECGGLVLCVHASHIVADGFTGITFIHAWAAASRLGIGNVIRPSFELPSLFPSRDISGVVKLPSPVNTGVKVITRRLLFDAATILALKARVGTCGASVNEREPTRVEVVISTIWKSIIRATQAKYEGQLRHSAITLSLNLRGRTALPTPENSYGNLYVGCLARFVAEESNMELNHLVGLVRDAVRNKLENCAKLSHGDEIFSMVVNSSNEAGKATHDENVDVHNFTSMCRFPIYEPDFGWGRPFWVSSVSLPVELVVLMDSKCGTGIEAWVSLKEPYILGLEQDPDIQPLMITSSSK